jgi:16S rRNA (cytidine1402-2'-O)-methyltransferase
MTPRPGTLYVVATPIGNLEDLTFRALRTLREVDLIAAEDTRRTAKLLAHYEIRKPLVSVREHNEAHVSARLVAKLAGGAQIALVTDAGTPGIADPGARLVHAARQGGVAVVPIPGPSAVAAALSISGLSGSEFVFMGFPPASGSARLDWFERLASEPRVIVFFEAPHRIKRTLGELREQLVNRPIQAHRELTKINEELVDGTSIDLTERGEFTIVVGEQPELSGTSPSDVDGMKILDLFGALTNIEAISADDAIDILAHLNRIPERAVAKAIKKAKILVKQSNQAVP